jgi:hypothetical protein
MKSVDEKRSDGVFQIEYDEALERSKVTISLRRRWGALILYTMVMVVWIAMIFVYLGYLIGGYSTSIVLTILVLFWLIIWLVFGRLLWKRWQYHVAGREILFIDREQVIIRRPVSILGITTAYDMDHVSPMYYSDKHGCPAFDYAYLHVFFGQDLPSQEADELIEVINSRWFPDSDETAGFFEADK